VPVMETEGSGGDRRSKSMQEAKAKTIDKQNMKTAEYVADLAGDLARIARENKFHTWVICSKWRDWRRRI